MSTEITIGADPEFGLIKNGGIVSANTMIRNSGDEFGVDGCGRVAELRPPYAHSASGLVKNIKKILQFGYDTYPDIRGLQWKAGGMACDEPIGGHIHLGHSKLTHATYRSKVGTALDRTLAVLCLMVEDGEEALNRRYGSSYGAIGGNASFREQNHGMEYRVLASWLTAPDEAEAILTLAYIVACEFDNEEIMEEAASLPNFDFNAFKECDKISLMYYIKPIVKFIRTLPKYKESEQAILPLFKLIRDQKTWACDKNMIDTWGLAKKEEPKKTVRKVAEYV